MDEFIIDTNVALVADPSTHMSATCSEACATFIEVVLSGKIIVVIDSDYILLEEYEHYRNDKNPFTYPHRFLKWVYTNHYNPKLFKQVKITQTRVNEFAEIPQSLKGIGIDSSDLKFISVAIANNKIAPIVEASDSKWIGWEADLNAEGIDVRFLCKDELKVIYDKKMKG